MSLAIVPSSGRKARLLDAELVTNGPRTEVKEFNSNRSITTARVQNNECMIESERKDEVQEKIRERRGYSHLLLLSPPRVPSSLAICHFLRQALSANGNSTRVWKDRSRIDRHCLSPAVRHQYQPASMLLPFNTRGTTTRFQTFLKRLLMGPPGKRSPC
ncbi:hypothetical protein EJ06DRAFT_119452 [Trichodelitschia bisporula]|uniref:Uncharacterized protein n=1 Tax=Trichodelitschia bisporula TaxID=703511 RepID=A0A6G1HPM2_9PEZI|nr:hypothetical protein EJ06DRAFT_119452 [Trichodelitschia bisporula]